MQKQKIINRSFIVLCAGVALAYLYCYATKASPYSTPFWITMIGFGVAIACIPLVRNIR